MKRIAVKIGSNVLTRKDGTLDITRMSALVDQVADLHRQGMEIVLISSGAVASGRSEIKAGKKDYKDKAGDALVKELQNHVKRVTAPYKYPRVVEFVDELPKTISGKIRRVEIRDKDNK